MEPRITPIAGAILVTLTLLGTLVVALNDPAINQSLFYPFGPDVGDSVMEANDDGSSGGVMINVGFPFFATSNTEVFVNTNGAISFGVAAPAFTPQSFPIANRMIAPYWCDIDTRRNNGRIYFRQSTDETLLNRATRDFVRSFSSKGLYFFKAKWIFIATWHNVTYYGGNTSTPINSFQAVLMTDGKHSATMFNYGWMSWTTGTSSGGDARTGRGGTAAQVGFNAGDNVTFLAVPWSRTDRIVQIGEHSNVGVKGRWLFRVDSATIEVSSGCSSSESKCEPHQQLNEENKCFDVAPAFDCPTLEGPVVIDRRWVEFYCVIPTKETSDEAAFNVTFLFNGEPAPTAPSIVVHSRSPKATLHERHLTYKLIGKWISCQVVSFWEYSKTNLYSRTTSSNSYWAGIEVSTDYISVYEGDPNPAILTLKSTIPITCKEDNDNPCNLTLHFASTPDILIRGKDSGMCSHTLREEDWKQEERKAYRAEARIEIYAKIDYAMSSPRYNSLTIDINEISDKETADGDKYKNMWSKHKLPDIMVYHHDIPQAVCRATGDPNLTTFDRLFYSVYASGQFTYVQTTRGSPIEVQVRHKPCGQTVSCVCGVAIRENEIILIAEKCNDNILRTVTPNDIGTLLRGVGITQDENGRSFEMTLPSNVRVVGYVTSWGMNIEIHVTSAEYRRTQGLCGSFDGNSRNDLKVKGSEQTHSPSSKSLPDVVESWRVPAGNNLFDGELLKWNDSQTGQTGDDGQSFCSCPEPATGCGNGVIDNKIPEGGNGNNRNRRNTLEQVEKHAKNEIPRRRRSSDDVEMSDYVDREYDGSAFNYSSPEPPRGNANASGVRVEDASRHCRRVLWDGSPLRTTCGNLVSMSDVNGIIEKCISDIRMTGDMSWADDKIPEIQNLCIFEAITANITESNSTIDEITFIVQQIAAVVCLPQDCSGHGTCRNGTCICDKGFVGSDCSLAKNAIPKIVRTLGPSSCDLDRFPCEKIEMVAENVTSLPTLVCMVDFEQSSNSTQSFKTSASVETLETASCKLPTDVLQGVLRLLRINSTSTRTAPSVDFHSLPLGSPVLRYSISITNNGIRFSNVRPFTVYDSRCYSCDGESCSRKNHTCLINGYCFASGDANPFNPECDRCQPNASSSSWTKDSDPLCDPCRSSPCAEGSTCKSKFKGEYTCTYKPYDRRNAILAVCLTLLVVIVIVVGLFLVIFFIRYRKRSAYKDLSDDNKELKESSGQKGDMKEKLTGSNF